MTEACCGQTEEEITEDSTMNEARLHQGEVDEEYIKSVTIKRSFDSLWSRPETRQVAAEFLLERTLIHNRDPAIDAILQAKDPDEAYKGLRLFSDMEWVGPATTVDMLKNTLRDTKPGLRHATTKLRAMGNKLKL